MRGPCPSTPDRRASSSKPGLASRLEITQGKWTGATSFSYRYLRCPDGGGAPDGSECTPTTKAPLSAPGVHLVGRADAGHSFRARVTATNAAGSTSSVSAASAAALDTEVNVTGCPPVQQAGATVEELKPPARLLIYRYTSTPAVITNSTQRLTLRVEVVACDNQTVRGAEVGDIWVMNADGSNALQLTDDPADELRPAWSPSGTKIVFRSLRTNQGDIYLMKADGSKQEQLTDDPAQDAYPDWQPLLAADGENDG
jgi:WD40 repeat protein